MVETHPLSPFTPKNSRYLLLGSFPSAKSPFHSHQFWYYTSVYNQFWPILSQVYQMDLAQLSAKKALFTKLGLAITDVIFKCQRQRGSSDKHLSNCIYNTSAIQRILNEYPIHTIYFTSRFVEKTFQRHLLPHLHQQRSCNLPLNLITLPSPSPRYARLSLSKKITIYSRLLPETNQIS